MAEVAVGGSLGRDFRRVLSANLVVALTSALSVLVIPRFVGVEEYGYWQLFMFVTSYSLLSQFGLADGAYLRYGGMGEGELRTRSIPQQLALLAALQSALFFTAILLLPLVFDDSRRVQVFYLASAYMVIVNLRHFLLLTLQAIGDFSASSRITLIDRLVYISLVCGLLTFGLRDYALLIFAELIAKAGTALLAIWACRRFMNGFWGGRLDGALIELRANVLAGIQLTLANTASMLIFATARIAIDWRWGIAWFGAVSLALNLTTFVMLFINAAGLVMFPILKRLPEARWPEVLGTLEKRLTAVSFGILILASPLTFVVSRWLPSYSEGISTFPILLPLVVFEAKMGLLYLPLMKAKRFERKLLWINLLGFLAATILVAVFTLALPSIQLVLLSLVAGLWIRSSLAEKTISHALVPGRHRLMWFEFGLMSVYVLTHMFLDGWFAMAAYGLIYLVVLKIVRVCSASTV